MFTTEEMQKLSELNQWMKREAKKQEAVRFKQWTPPPLKNYKGWPAVGKTEELIKRNHLIWLDRISGKTYKEVASIHGLSGSRIMDICNTMLRKLRHPARTRKLKEVSSNCKHGGLAIHCSRCYQAAAMEIENGKKETH